MLIQLGTTGALGRPCWDGRMLQRNSEGCVGTAEYYRSNLEPVLVQQSTISALGRLC